jgi:hypothetical protein
VFGNILVDGFYDNARHGFTCFRMEHLTGN